MSVKKSAVKSIRSLLAFALVFCLCFSVMPSVLVYATGDGTAGMEGEAAETGAVPGSGKVISEEAETPATPAEEAETPAAPAEEAETPAAPAEGTETDTEKEESKLTEEDKTIPGAKEEESGTPAGEQGSFRLNTLFVPMGGQGTAQLTVENVEANAGDTNVTVDVSIADCPVFYGLILEASYDESGLTLTDIIRGPATTIVEGNFTTNTDTGRILFDAHNIDTGMTASDDVLFTLVFNVKGVAGGDYDIEVAVEQFIDTNNDDLPISVTNGVLTVIPALDAHEAKYNNKYYEKLEDAIAAAVDDGGTGNIEILKDITISDFGDRIIIPTGADITLDLDGHTITSAIPCSGGANNPTYIVELEEGAQLNLVDNSDMKGGKFVHNTGEAGSTFLRNAGTLNMSNVDVMGFYYGILDNSSNINDFKGTPGTYGTICNCEFITEHCPMNFENASVDNIIGCTIETTGGELGGAFVNSALVINGTINLLEDCYIASNAQTTVKVWGGRIETIRDCTIVNETSNPNNAAIYLTPGSDISPGGSIGTITSTSPEKHTTITGMVECFGTIELIEGNDTLFDLPSVPEMGSNWYNVHVEGNDNWEAEIEAITGGRFENGEITLYIASHGRIGTISGGIFNKTESSSYYNVYNAGTIETISGGEFINSAASYNFCNLGTVNLINGGEFYTTKGSALFNFGGTIGTISGGEFRSTASNAVWNYSGTINSITDSSEGRYPRFSGKSAALNNAATIGSLTGGYYKKTATDGDWISSTGSATIPTGYDFSTVPMYAEDMDGEEGYYHFGETVNITWRIEGQEDKIDKFVNGNPVYYNHEAPYFDGLPFSGWRCGDDLYKPGDSFPPADEDVIYIAEFLPGPEDYKVSLVNAPQGVYSGQDFTIDVIIASGSNTKFHGATIDVIYDNSKVTYNGELSSKPESFGILSKATGTTTTLTIVGAAEEGYSMTATDGGYAYTLATLAFTANRDTTGEAVLAIGDNPVVDQEDAVLPVTVEKSDDITVILSPIIVSFDSNGGSDVPSQVLNYGDNAAEPEHPTWVGKYFQGWYEDESLTELYNFDEIVTESFTLYAKWGDKEYTLIYTAGPNGSISGDAEQTVIHGQSGTEVTAVPGNGYYFVKWSDDNTDNPRTDTNVTGDITVTAIFAPIEYSITYHLDGGDNDPGNPTVYTIESETITLKNAARTGYTFDGWYDAETGGNKVTQIVQGSTGNIALYARWTANQYTVAFDSNGGDTPIPVSKEVIFDQPYGDLAEVTRAGHTFLGWFTEPTGGTLITAESIVKIADNHTLYAQWEHNVYAVTFKAGDNVIMEDVTAFVKHYTGHDDLGIWADETCETLFTEPSPVPDNGYTLDDPVWRSETEGINVSFEQIKNTQFTGPAAYIATASPSKYDVIYDSSRVDFVSGITEGKATYLTDIVFTVMPKPGHVPVVQYRVGDGEFAIMTAMDGKYTIGGEVILGDIEIQVSDTIDGEVNFISNDVYRALPGDYKLLLFSAPAKLESGAYEYNGNAMFYSGRYSTENGAQVYLYAVPGEVTEEEAKDNIRINETAGLCTELAYSGDVNLDGRIISTDAVLTYGLYKGIHTDDANFTTVSMQMRLEADVFGDDGVVDTMDALSILNKIWGK